MIVIVGIVGVGVVGVVVEVGTVVVCIATPFAFVFRESLALPIVVGSSHGLLHFKQQQKIY